MQARSYTRNLNKQFKESFVPLPDSEVHSESELSELDVTFIDQNLNILSNIQLNTNSSTMSNNQKTEQLKNKLLLSLTSQFPEQLMKLLIT